MRMSCSDAFEGWANTAMDQNLKDRDALTRLEWIMKDIGDNLRRDLDYAFQAGWVAALRNLTTSDI